MEPISSMCSHYPSSLRSRLALYAATSHEGVSFGYGGDRPAISDISFEAAAARMVALVGATGA